MTEFYIVRHGRTFANAAGLKQGTINTPQTYLTDEGRAQAQLLAQNFDLRDFDALYVSPLERTKQTAAILNEERNCRSSKKSVYLRFLMGGTGMVSRMLI